MNRLKVALSRTWPPVVIAAILLLTIDYFLGDRLVLLLIPEHERLERRYRVYDPVYHHGLARAYQGIGIWGERAYRVCTNRSGFKDVCDKDRQVDKDIDIAFIGDSFTEGIGLRYEDTFVGRIASALPGKRIANLAVSSYSPSIYLAKVRRLLEDGYRFRHLVVYMDISDVQDEAIAYEYRDGLVTDPGRAVSQRLKHYIRLNFPVSYQALLVLRDLARGTQVPSGVTLTVTSRDYDRSAWTYNEKSPGYGDIGVNGALNRSLDLMTELHEVLRRRGIGLSVGVYPWPAQLLYDVEDSRQVSIWREFCATRCEYFINSFPTFFDRVKAAGTAATIDRYFFKGDVHFNANGARLVADDFLHSWQPDR